VNSNTPYVMNECSSLDETLRGITTSPTYHLDYMLDSGRSKVKVTPWSKYVMAKACTLTLGLRSPYSSSSCGREL